VKNFVLLILITIASTVQSQYIQVGSKITGANISAASKLGYSVDISSDGKTAIIGVPEDLPVGGALIYSLNNNDVWTYQTKLVGADYIVGGSTRCRQGFSVAISGDGNTAVIGDPDDDDWNGAIYIFRKQNNIWKEIANFWLEDIAKLGYSVDISDDGKKIIAGAPFTSNYLNRREQGGAIIYVEKNGAWNLLGNFLTTSDINSGALEGAGVAISGDGKFAALGAPGRDYAQFYKIYDDYWQLDGSQKTGYNMDEFGTSISISSDGMTAVIGEPGWRGGRGAVHVYSRLAGVWELKQKLEGELTGGRYLGWDVSISADGKTIVAGASGYFEGSRSSFIVGSAFTWKLNGNSWIPTNGENYYGNGYSGNSQQGTGVAVSGNGSSFLIGGANDASDNGAFWFFKQSTNPNSNAAAFQNNNMELKIFPNPTNEFINLTLPEQATKILKFKVYNAFGAEVNVGNELQNDKQLSCNVSLLTQGFYTVIITTSNQTYQTGFIKK
jgi:hypothetical protein